MLARFNWKSESTPVDGEIIAVMQKMREVGVDSEEYPKLMTLLERLTEIDKKKSREPVSRDTIALVLGNLVGILLIVAYEQKHVLTSKGFAQIIKPK